MQIRAYLHPPWLDLPVPLTETILERLPLSHYLLFAAVCRRWLLINPLDHGWLLIADQGIPNLFNPVSGAKIALPPLINAAAFPPVFAVAISPPRVNYSVSVIGSSTVFLHRWFHSSWMEFDLPNGHKPIKMSLSMVLSTRCILLIC